MAVEKGLKPLAELILSGEFNGDIVEEANKYINEDRIKSQKILRKQLEEIIHD